jgi:hypothetical protein
VHTRARFGRLRMLIDRINSFAAARPEVGSGPPAPPPADQPVRGAAAIEPSAADRLG